MSQIIERILSIPGDYQYKALNTGLWPQRNWHINKFTALEAVLNFSDEIEILDLGSGSGNFELIFSKKVKSITAVDYNDEALLFLRNKLTEEDIHNVTLVEADIKNLLEETVKNRKYNYVVLVDVIEHLILNECVLLLENIKSLLKKDGSVVVVTPNYKSSWVFIERLLDEFKLVPKLNNAQHLTKFDLRMLNSTLGSCGFYCSRWFTFNSVSYLLPFKSINKYLLKIEKKYLGELGCLIVLEAKVM